MLRRVKGKDKHCKISTVGVPILNRKEFYEWSLGQQHFHDLHKNWVDSNYSKALTPSLIRIDLEKGYVLGNIKWVRLEEQWTNKINKMNEVMYGS